MAAAGSPDEDRRELAKLVEAAKNGDHRAFEDLVRATYAETYILAYRLAGNEDDARDLVQEAYLRAYRALRRFRGDSRFTTWLYRITANCAMDLIAKRSKTHHEELPEDAPLPDARADHDPELAAAVGEERVRVAGALAQLPWRLRQVVVLHDIYDLPHGAIATELGITEAAAKVRLHRARRKLRESLETVPELHSDELHSNELQSNELQSDQTAPLTGDAGVEEAEHARAS